jgi:transposase
LKGSYYNAISVPGVGPVTAAALLIATENFTRFKSAKQLGCYCGVVPFERSSGTYKGKQRVSNKANKQLKTLLHMGALSVMSSNNLMGKYYQRKIEEGKNRMSALNSLRNKILKTIFACVVNKQKYRADYQYKMPS